MNVSHHLTDETIQDYAAGSLSMPMETLVACHLTVCNVCRQHASMADEIGGNLFDSAEPASVSLTAAELLARSATPQHSVPLVTTPTASETPIFKGVPRPLARLLPAPLEELDWRRLTPGIKQHNLTDQHRKHGAFQLLRLDPGVVISAHSHNDRELTYLLQGSYSDELGRFKPGDISDLAGHQKDHQPIVDSDIPCIALIATDSPVRYSSMVGKIMQPFVGI